MKTNEMKKYVYVENIDKFVPILNIATIVVDTNDVDYNKLPVYLLIGENGWKHMKANQYHFESDYKEIYYQLENPELILLTYIQAEGLNYSDDEHVHDTFDKWFDKKIAPEIKKLVNTINKAQYALAIQERTEKKAASMIFPELMTKK